MIGNNPYLIHGEDAKGEKLKVLSPKEKKFQEGWLQLLLYKNPEIVPIEYIHEDFGPLIPIGREIANIDNLFISPKGLITIIETKLWRNPEAHRTVVAQILDYARILSSMKYSELDNQVKNYMQKALGKTISIYEIVKKYSKAFELSDIEFQAKVSKCLEDGKFALLIVGDKIFPEATQLAEIIQSAPHIQFSLGFIELRCFRTEQGQDWPLLVIPNFITKTKEITRAIIQVVYKEKPEIEITTPPEEKTSLGFTNFPAFIANLPRDFQEVFRSYIDRWMQAGYIIYWGKVGFSLRINWNKKLRTLFDAYPDMASIIQEKYAKEFILPLEDYRAYKQSLMQSPLISSTFASGRRYVYFDKVSKDDVLLLLSVTDNFVKTISKNIEYA